LKGMCDPARLGGREWGVGGFCYYKSTCNTHTNMSQKEIEIREYSSIGVLCVFPLCLRHTGSKCKAAHTAVCHWLNAAPKSTLFVLSLPGGYI